MEQPLAAMLGETMAKLNVQGLSRRDEGLMRCFVPDEGYTAVSCDLSAGEPTATSHFSQDKNYLNASFNMVGKEPYYDRDGVLQIDDIYLMVASVSPLAKDVMKDLFSANFSEQWLDNADVIKKNKDVNRPLHKALTLGLGYSMGPKKLVDTAFNSGHEISLSTAREFFNAYWKLFADVKKLGERLETQYLKQGYLVNPFGYKLTPDPSYKALNYYIQSTVSGIMHILCEQFFHKRAPWCRFITVIHDEVLFDCPTDRLTEAKQLMIEAETALNTLLGWTVQVRVGWEIGDDWYEAK